MIEILEKIIDDAIDSLEILKSSILIKNENTDKINDLKNKINTIIESPKKILDLTEEDLNNIESISKDSISNVKLYSIIIRNSNIDLDEEFNINLQNLFKKVNSDINKYLELNKINSDKISSIVDEIKVLKEWKEKLNYNYFTVESKDIDFIIDILTKYGMSQNDIIDLLKEIILSKMHSYKSNSEYDNLIEETNLNEDEVIQLFLSYGYDFKKFKDSDRKEILHHGKLDNMKRILDAFKKYNVMLDNNLIHLKSNQLMKILIYSNEGNVIKLFDFCINNGMVINGNININHLVNYPSRFITRQHPYKKRNKTGNDGPFSIEETGCIDDFISNYEFFKDEYLKTVGQSIEDNDFYEKIYLSKSSLFNISHEKILNTVQIFSKYGITSLKYFKALSSFLVSNPEEILDLYVELGILDYIKNNLTYIVQSNKDFFDEISIANRADINCFGYANRVSLHGTIKPTLYYKHKGIKQYIALNNLKFEPYNLERIFDTDELKIFDEYNNIIENNKLSSTNFDFNSSKLIEKLESDYTDSNDNLVYNIKGIRISKYKVYRIYNKLKMSNIDDNAYSISYILTHNSLITDEEFLIIYEEACKIMEELKEEKKI